MLSVYPAIFYREQDNSYSVVFPDLNHLSTFGSNYNEAIEMAVDCLAGYLYESDKNGHSRPLATPINKVNIHSEDDEEDNYSEEDITVTMINVDVEEYAKKHFNQSVKKTLTIPRWMNDKANAAGVNFSQVLQKALENELCSTK